MNFQLTHQSTFLTYLNVIVPSNDCYCVTVAIDLRDTCKREKSDLLGVAVMLPAPQAPRHSRYEAHIESFVGKSWLVPISK